MKLRILAVAILAATVSVSAQAEVTFSGDMSATLNANDADDLTSGANLNVNASQEANGITYFGSGQIEFSKGAAVGDAIHVGMKGGFGQLNVGDTANGCNATDVGGYSDQIHDIGTAGCSGGDEHNITYIGSAGAITYAASYSPKASQDDFSIGANAKLGAATISLGHTDSNTGATTVLGLAGAFGPVSVGVRISDIDGSTLDNPWVAQAKYSSGANTFAIGTSDNGTTEKSAAYWVRDLGGNTSVTAEVADLGGTSSTFGALKLKHTF